MGRSKNQESMLADQASELYRLNNALAEKDREIERLEAERDLATHKCITCGVAAENPEIASKGVYVEKWDSPQAQAVRKVVAQLSASQAREREAVERAEALAKNQAHIQERIQAALGNGADEQAWEPGEHWLMAACRGLSALAAARKALEDAQTLIESGSPQMALMVILAALNGDSHAE